MRCSRPGRAGDRPRPRERLRVAQVGQELVAGVRCGRELDVEMSGSSATSGISHGSEPFAR